MSATATRLIYRAAGEPPIAAYGIAADERPGSCRLCGQSGEGIAFEAWIKDTFMDHDQLYPGDVVCRACLFCVDDHSTALQALTGRDKPQRMRNYTHIVTAEGQWLALGKDQKSAILAALTHGHAPRLASIAIGGQKTEMGWGAVADWSVEPSSVDWSVRDAAGRLTRPVPAETGMLYGYRPPYWHPRNQTTCEMPSLAEATA